MRDIYTINCINHPSPFFCMQGVTDSLPNRLIDGMDIMRIRSWDSTFRFQQLCLFYLWEALAIRPPPNKKKNQLSASKHKHVRVSRRACDRRRVRERTFPHLLARLVYAVAFVVGKIILFAKNNKQDGGGGEDAALRIFVFHTLLNHSSGRVAYS